MKPWEKKAHKLIAALCFQAWKAANVLPDGRIRRKHVPYSVPETARDLVTALGRGDEEMAKSIFLYRYDAQ